MNCNTVAVKSLTIVAFVVVAAVLLEVVMIERLVVVVSSASSCLKLRNWCRRIRLVYIIANYHDLEVIQLPVLQYVYGFISTSRRNEFELN